MKPTHTLPLLLTTSGCVIAGAAPPVFTFTTGRSLGGSWFCPAYYPDQPSGVEIHIAVSSNGETQVSGICVENSLVAVTFSNNRVDWKIDAWKNGTCGRCVFADQQSEATQQPRVSCSTPFYAAYREPFLTMDVADAAFTAQPKTSWGHPDFNYGNYGDYFREGSMSFTFCRDDFDASGAIDGGDIGMMMLWWGASNENHTLYFCSRMDLDEDGEIGASDIALLLLDWGECPTPNV